MPRRPPRPPTCLPLVRIRRSGPSGGFTLVEVLVALAVLSIGLMGAAGLSLASYRAQQAALLEHLALTAAEDMAGRIRANAVGLGAYGGPAADLPCTPGAGPVVACTPEEMAARDLADWQALLATLLPGGTGEVRPEAGPPAAARIRVRWRGRDGVRAVDLAVTP